MKRIQLDKFFLECSEFHPSPNEEGNMNRSRNGKAYTQINYKFESFELVLEGVSPSMHSNLLYVVDKNRDWNSTAENLTLVDDLGNTYTVTIPPNSYDFDREQGEGETWKWSMTLEEVL